MIVYFSGASGFTKSFVDKLGVGSERIPNSIKESKEFIVDCEYVLIVPTYELKNVHGPNPGSISYVPRQVKGFLSNEVNRNNLVGVIGTGNRNFYKDFAKAAEVISKKFDVPILYRLELSGTDTDVNIVKEGLTTFWQQRQISHQQN